MGLHYEHVVESFLESLPELAGSRGDVDRSSPYAFFGHMCLHIAERRRGRPTGAFASRLAAFLNDMADSRDAELEKLLHLVVFPLLEEDWRLMDRVAGRLSTRAKRIRAASAAAS